MDLGLVAGEASGDLLGAHCVRALRQRTPDVRVAGIAGPRLIEAGVEALYPSEKLAVSGYVDVLRRLPELLWIRSRIARRFLRERPRVFVGIDAPDFNFGLEARLKRGGIPTVHFIGPSLWAWRPERIHRIKQAVSHMLVVFPFEEKIYQDADIPVTYVGHPLADVIPLNPDTAGARAELGLGNEPVIALLPGSRLGEVRHHTRLMLDAAQQVAQQRPGVQFVMPAASYAAGALIQQAAQAYHFPLQVLDGCAHTALAACDVALVASGTATLETALFKKPMVITYRTHPLTARMMLKQALLPWVGLPNVLENDWVVPERIQDAATAANLATDLVAWLDDAPRRAATAERFQALHLRLRQNASEKIADAISPYLHA